MTANSYKFLPLSAAEKHDTSKIADAITLEFFVLKRNLHKVQKLKMDLTTQYREIIENFL